MYQSKQFGLKARAWKRLTFNPLHCDVVDALKLEMKRIPSGIQEKGFSFKTNVDFARHSDAKKSNPDDDDEKGRQWKKTCK